MPAVFPGNTTPCNDWSINANELNTALDNAEILSQGNLTLTRIDGSTTVNSIPYFVDFIISGIALSQEPIPNLNEINYTGGTYQINAQIYTLALGGTIFCDPSDPTFDRIDLIYLDTLGAINYLPGLAVLNPVVPTLPPNCLKVAEIGVEAGATGSSGYTLTSININNVITSAGFLENQTLRWNSVSGKWVPTSGLLTNTAQQTVIGGIAGFGGMDALTKLQVGGAINIEANSAPIPTTDKLYNVGGNLYWDGSLLGLTNGVTTGSHLYWDGSAWVENNILLRETTPFSVDSILMDTTDVTGVRTEMHLGNVPVAGERGFQFFINDTLNDNNLYCLMTAQDSINNLTTFKVNQQDTNLGDNSNFLLSTKRNSMDINDATTGTFYETVQTTAGGVVNRATSSTNEAFVKVQPNQINIASINTVTPTTYSDLIQVPTGFQLYSNNSNVNLISNIVTNNGAINLNGGLIKRYVNTAINRAVVENDNIIVATTNPLTITLPAAPTDGRLLTIKAITATGGSPITINGNGKNINGGAITTITTNYGFVRLQFNASLNIWITI